MKKYSELGYTQKDYDVLKAQSDWEETLKGIMDNQRPKSEFIANLKASPEYSWLVAQLDPLPATTPTTETSTTTAPTATTPASIAPSAPAGAEWAVGWAAALLPAWRSLEAAAWGKMSEPWKSTSDNSLLTKPITTFQNNVAEKMDYRDATKKLKTAHDNVDKLIEMKNSWGYTGEQLQKIDEWINKLHSTISWLTKQKLDTVGTYQAWQNAPALEKFTSSIDELTNV